VSGTPGVALEVGEVTVRFGGLLALENVSLTVQEGSVAGLIGPNGAGKTTLFNAVTGVHPPTAGRVQIFGRDVSAWSPHKRARLGVGRTFQRLELFGSLTVLENLVMAAETHLGRGNVFTDLLALPATIETRWEAEERALAVLDLIGMSDRAAERAGDLPLGLSRLVELGRALCTEPKLLLLDEPSSGLRLEESRRLAGLLASLRTDQGMSLLVVEHDMAFVLGLCDDITVLDFGRVIAGGTPEEIRRDPVVQAAYLGEEVEDAAAARR
jgi:ABC-type branched-subunit amino acid transport system ATPase component